MPTPPINQYLQTLRRDLRGGDTTEASHYPTLKTLLEASARGIVATVVPKGRECGFPDFHVKKGDLIVGHVEAKNVGSSLDDAEQTEQLKDRYLKALDNLVLTNFLEFRWYIKGERRRVERLGTLESGANIKASRTGREAVLDLLRSFLAEDPQGAQNAKDLAVRLARYAHEIRNVVVQGFAQDHVSDNTRDLRDAVKKELVPDLTDEQFADMFAQTLAYGFFAAWCNHPTGKPFQRLGAAAEIPKTNPFLRQVFELTTGTALDVEPFVGYVDDVVQLLAQTEKDAILEDFGRRTGREDPVVHFYETFLAEYDPKIREMRGVYYTPEPVVSYMVRSVDHLLRTRFNCPNGLADTAQVEYQIEGENGEKITNTSPRVLILDPACGTGTFLFEIVNQIRDDFIRKRQAGAWSSYVREQLLPRLFGFELLMAPYAMAHLKLGMQLAGQDLDEAQRADYAYDFSGDDRLGIFLTNTLEEAARKSETLFGPLRVITQEANAAAEIKTDKPIMVVIGNPPYSGHSANRSWEKKNGKRVRTFIGKLVQDYSAVDGRPLRAKQPKWLQDDYVKFIRFGQWRIQKTVEQAEGGGGILALITNHSYLDSPTFRGMRQQLMQTFTDIYILDLHGNARKKEVCPDGSPDKNVFDIQQGVAIAILAKDPDSPGPARIFHADLWGLREPKEDFLSEHTCQSVEWQQIAPQSPDYLFVPQDAELLSEYNSGRPLPDAMDQNGDPAPGVVTTHDDFAISLTPEEAKDKVRRLLDTASEEEARSLFKLCSQAQWSYARAKQELSTAQWRDRVGPLLYRPFDKRWTVWDRNVAVHQRLRVTRHMVSRDNLALVTSRLTKGETFEHAMVARHPIEVIFLSPKTSNNAFLFPLHLYPDPEHSTINRDQKIEDAVKQLASAGDDSAAQQHVAALIRRLFPHPEYPRWPNLNPLLLADLEQRLGLRFLPDGQGDLEQTFGPEDVFNYIYAILHSPAYRERYADFLKRDFPRIPFTSDRALFAKLAEKGRQLVALHLLESDLLAGVMPDFPEKGSDIVERVRYADKDHRVYINKTQYFANVPANVWGFRVGGYQVCEKWLKDRAARRGRNPRPGRKLSYADQEHYTKVTVALRETIRLMNEIDGLIPSWPLV